MTLAPNFSIFDNNSNTYFLYGKKFSLPPLYLGSISIILNSGVKFTMNKGRELGEKPSKILESALAPQITHLDGDHIWLL